MLHEERVAKRLRERRLAGARVVFEQHVAVGEEGDEDELDDAVAADDFCAHLGAKAFGDGVGFGEGGVVGHGVLSG